MVSSWLDGWSEDIRACSSGLELSSPLSPISLMGSVTAATGTEGLSSPRLPGSECSSGGMGLWAAVDGRLDGWAPKSLLRDRSDALVGEELRRLNFARMRRV